MNIKNDPALELFDREIPRRFGAFLRQVIDNPFLINAMNEGISL